MYYLSSVRVASSIRVIPFRRWGGRIIFLRSDLDNFLKSLPGCTVEEVLKKHYAIIFEQELVEWHLVEKDWPQKRDLKTFKDWFEVEAHSMVLDVCDYAFEFEEFAA